MANISLHQVPAQLMQCPFQVMLVNVMMSIHSLPLELRPKQSLEPQHKVQHLLGEHY